MKKIAFFGVPRSGTSWLSTIFNSHPDVAMRFQPLFSYGHKGKLTDRSSAEEIYSFFDEIFQSRDPFVLLQEGPHKSAPRFEKSGTFSHIVFKETRYLHIIENILRKTPDVKIVGIVRNPLAVLASWVKAPKEFASGDDIMKEWRFAPSKNRNLIEEFYGFEKWKSVALDFLRFSREYPSRFMLVSYGDLNKDPVAMTEEIFRFCDLLVHRQTLDFIKASKSVHNEDPYSVFRAQAGDENWHETLPAEIIDAILEELQNSSLKMFL